jgi:hypothetical protein
MKKRESFDDHVEFIHQSLITATQALAAAQAELIEAKRGAQIYIDWNDWWIGYYRGSHYHFVIPVPCVVIRWRRNGADSAQ